MVNIDADRINKTTFRPETRPNCKKLTPHEEQTIVRHILDLNLRGFGPQLCEVADMANEFLAVRGGEPVGKRWAETLVTRSKELKMAFNRTKDYQRKIQEDPEAIKA